MSTVTKSGVLYIVATPLGNKDDMSLRAIQTLKVVDVVAAEDTRHSRPLLQTFGVETPLISYHDHNEADRSIQLVRDYLLRGKSIALISDAGTPLISDPGYNLVRCAYEHECRVVPIPGACAAIAALSVSGLPSDRFSFEGFLAAKGTARKKQLQTLSTQSTTIILYESPHRIEALLEDIREVMGEERQLVLARELTKTFETIIRGTVAEVCAVLSADSNQKKGEFVVVIEGALLPEVDTAAPISLDVADLLRVLVEALPVKQAAALAHKITRLPKNDLYQRALQMLDR